MRKTTGSCCSWFAPSLCLFMFVMISGGCAMPEAREAPQPAPELPTELEAKLDACLVLIPKDATEHDRRVREELCQELYGAPPSVPRGGMGSGGEELL